MDCVARLSTLRVDFADESRILMTTVGSNPAPPVPNLDGVSFAGFDPADRSSLARSSISMGSVFGCSRLSSRACSASFRRRSECRRG